MVAVPSLGLKISLAYINFKEGEALSPTSRISAAVAMIMLVLVVVSWPIFVAALQFGARDLAVSWLSWGCTRATTFVSVGSRARSWRSMASIAPWCPATVIFFSR